MKKIAIVSILFLFAYCLRAQTPAPTKEIAVKSSTSQDELVRISKEFTDANKQLNDAVQEATAALDQQNKPILAKMDEIKKQIKPFQDQIDENLRLANTKFEQVHGGLRNTVQTENAQIQELEKVVKKEFSLPDDATFNPATGKWSIPDKTAAEKK